MKPSGKTTPGVVGPRVFQGSTQSTKQTVPTEQGIKIKKNRHAGKGTRESEGKTKARDENKRETGSQITY